MSFRQPNNLTSSLRQKNKDLSITRDGRRQHLLQKKRVDDLDTIPKPRSQPPPQLTRKEDEFYTKLVDAIQTENEEYLNQVISTISEYISVKSEAVPMFCDRLIPKLVEFLSRIFNSPLHIQIRKQDDRVLKAICNILVIVSEGDSQSCLVLTRLNIIPLTFKLFQEREEVVLITFYIVGNLMMYPGARDQYLEFGILNIITQLLSWVLKKETMYKHAAWIMSSICKTSPTPDPTILANHLPLLVKMLDIGDDQINIDCVSAIQSLYVNPSYFEILQSLQVEQRLLHILTTTNNMPLLGNTIKCIGTYIFASFSSVYFGEFVIPLVNFTQHKQIQIRKLSFWALSNLCVCDNVKIFELVVIKGGFLSACKTVIGNDDPRIRLEAAWVVVNILYKGYVLEQIIGEYLYHAVVTILSFEDPTIVELALSGLLNGIKTEKANNSERLINGLNGVDVLDNVGILINSSHFKISKLATELYNYLDDNNITI
ncbi:Importin alpha [Entamoeba marina]